MTAAAMRTPAVGETAPDFTLPSTAGGTVTLSSLHGRNVLLAFFPLAFSSVCTTEMCAFRDDFDQFVSRDVTILPISVDSTYSLREFKAKHSMQTDLLSDFRREASVAYGVLLPEKFYSTRAYFLIDRAGIIRWAHVEEHPGLRRDNAEIMRHIDAID